MISLTYRLWLFFFIRRLPSACHVERSFSLLGRILTKDRLVMGNDTLPDFLSLCT